jgi:hypothetical protein
MIFHEVRVRSSGELSAEVVEGATEDDFYGIVLKSTCLPKVSKKADLPRFFL